MFFSVCSPTSPRSFGRSSPNLGVHFLKVKVIEVKGQISVSRQSMKLGECTGIQADPRLR